MTAVTFSPESRQDLLDIGDYIAKDSLANARRFVGRLVDQCRQIGQAPLANPERSGAQRKFGTLLQTARGLPW
ncbi:MAG: type II toxin-antitoxin system RelE/ParE family toxin [Magnetococcales bacterium]|nr:type II toxin-antitoxin system RelE/ParE family toxin [Magnetococcales bacterium]